MNRYKTQMDRLKARSIESNNIETTVESAIQHGGCPTFR